jgi:hypothetical protein
VASVLPNGDKDDGGDIEAHQYATTFDSDN